MSERIVRFLLSEIKTVRITCLGCQTPVEVPVAALKQFTEVGKCRICGHRIRRTGQTDPFIDFSKSLAQLAQWDTVRVEIAMPAEERE